MYDQQTKIESGFLHSMEKYGTGQTIALNVVFFFILLRHFHHKLVQTKSKSFGDFTSSESLGSLVYVIILEVTGSHFIQLCPGFKNLSL